MQLIKSQRDPLAVTIRRTIQTSFNKMIIHLKCGETTMNTMGLVVLSCGTGGFHDTTSLSSFSPEEVAQVMAVDMGCCCLAW